MEKGSFVGKAPDGLFTALDYIKFLSYEKGGFENVKININKGIKPNKKEVIDEKADYFNFY